MDDLTRGGASGTADSNVSPDSRSVPTERLEPFSVPTVVAVWYRAGISIETLRTCVDSLRSNAGASPFALVLCNLATEHDLSALVDLRPGGGMRSGLVLNFGTADVAPALNAVWGRYPDADLVRLRADVMLDTAGWLDRLRQHAAERPELGVLGGRLLSVDGRIRSVGRNPVGGLGVLPRAANLRHYEVDRYADVDPATVAPIEVDSVSGAFSFYRREALQAVGGLDTQFVCELGEDDDFCLSARKHGFDVCVDPSIAALDLSPGWTPTSYDGEADFRKLLKKTKLVELGLWRAHAPYWRDKWGYDPRYPDLAEVRRLYGDTKICWRIGSAMEWRPSVDRPAVDVAIVTWNNAALLERCLRSLAETRYDGPVEVHVTDNGSSDNTLAVLEAARSWLPFPLHVHDLVVNTGVTVGFNWSIVHGSSELVARLDDDVVLPEDWLEKLVETMHRRPHAGCVGPKILNDNVRKTIQCGPFRMFPGTFGHTDEEDHGQADYVARCSHVRGCCNLYRRDVLDAVGLFDLRYAPSQWDDPDHHMALLAAGYEVLYDGRVGVVHALTTGKGRTWAATSNQHANKSKLEGKWSQDCWQIVEMALDTSRLGRVLPDDEGAWLRSVPLPSSYPRRAVRKVGSVPEEQARKLLAFDQMARVFDGPLDAEWQKIVNRASAMIRDRNSSTAAKLLHGMLDHTPTHVVALSLLVQSYVELAMPEDAARYLQIARRIRPEADWSELGRSVAKCAELRSPSDVGDRTSEIGETQAAAAAPGVGDEDSSALRVLMTNTFMPRTAGGDMMQIGKVAEYLRKAGVHVDVCYRAHPSTQGYDLAHVHNLWFPAQTLPQVRGLRTCSPELPIACTPIYWDMGEKNWAEQAIPEIFSASNSNRRQALLEVLADGSLDVDGVKRADAESSAFPGFDDYQQRILDMVDWLLPQSEVEASLLRETFGLSQPHTVVTNGAEREIFEAAQPEPFREALGLASGQDFVLTVGLVEVRKNQIMLLQALAGTGIHVVSVGRNYDPSYLAACREVGGGGVTFVEHLPHAMLASAMKAARVFALPSWMECAAIASLEAAVAGCPIVVGNRTSEHEVFGDAAYLCDPASVDSIRNAVLRAWKERDEPAVATGRAILQQRLAQECTWQNAAVQTLRGYVELLSQRGSAAAAAKARAALERAESAAGTLASV